MVATWTLCILLALRLAAADPQGEPVPGPEAMLAAYQALDGWVRSGQVPAQSQLLDPPGSTGACVTLRLSGRVIARASVMGADRQTVWKAAREALVQAAPALRPAGTQASGPLSPELATHTLIDLQFASELTPLLGEDFASAVAEVAPGIDGVAARVGDRMEAVFPATMLETGALPGEGLRVAVAKLSLPPVELSELRKKHGLTVYRFGSRQLAQCGAGHAPTFLYRSGRIIGLAEVTGPNLRRAAAEIAGNLARHEWPGSEPHGMTGDYNPLTDRYDPIVAPPLPQALTAFAMARYASTPGLTPAERDRAMKFAGRLLDRLTAVAPGEDDPLANPVDAAMVVIARVQLDRALNPERPESLDGFFASAGGRVEASISAGGRWSADAPAQGRAIIAFAMALGASLRPEDVSVRAKADSAVRALFRETDRSRLVGELPWLGWAELELARAPGQPVPAGPALREIRDAAWEHQVEEAETDATSLDLAGGILFNRGRTPLPTWHTLRPVAFLATSLGDPRLTDSAELPHELAALKRSLRFLLQLQAERTVGHMFQDQDRALGGIRAAPWDQRMSIEASALGLLALSETLSALAQRAPPAPGTAPDAGK